MSLRGIKPEFVKKRLKVFIYGASGVGKTTCALQFPNPYFVDCEGGGQQKKYVDLLNKGDGLYFSCTEFEELLKEVKALLTTQHSYKTLVIDPLTILYNDLLDKSAKEKVSKENPDGTAYGAHYGLANKKMKQLVNLLLRLDMNVIITSHSKNEYGDNLKVLGQTFDCYRKIDYIFDLVFEVTRKGNKRFAIVKKTRLEEFETDSVFDFSYQEIATRYDADMLEKDAVPEQMATTEQVERLKFLVETFKEPEETVQKWLDKAQASDFSELKADIIAKIIAHEESKFKTGG